MQHWLPKFKNRFWILLTSTILVVGFLAEALSWSLDPLDTYEEQYSYDELGRLKETEYDADTSDEYNEKYEYDPAGNRILKLVTTTTVKCEDVEADEGLTATVRCVRTGKFAAQQKFDWSVNLNEAEADDVQAGATLNGTIEFTDNTTAEQTFDIPLEDDVVYEASEKLTVNLSNPSADLLIEDDQSDITILDNDPAPKFSVSIDPDSITEEPNSIYEDEVATFIITLTGETEVAHEISYATEHGGGTGEPTLDNDYTPISGTLTFGGPTTKTVQVQAAYNPGAEVSKAFSLRISNPTEGAELEVGQDLATVTILDGVNIDFKIAGAGGGEDLGGKEIIFTRKGYDGLTHVVGWEIVFTTPAGVSPSEDFVAANQTDLEADPAQPLTGTLTFSAGQFNEFGQPNNTRTIDVNIEPDSSVEADEILYVRITSISVEEPNAVANVTGVGNAAGVVILNDDDAADASFAIASTPSPITAIEGAPAMVRIERSGTTLDSQHSFFLQTSAIAEDPNLNPWEQTSAATSDFDDGYHLVFFDANELFVEVPIATTDDEDIELDERFDVRLIGPVTGGATVDPFDYREVNILDDDTPVISISDITVTEGDTFTLQVQRSGSTQHEDIVQIAATSGGTAAYVTDFVLVDPQPDSAVVLGTNGEAAVTMAPGVDAVNVTVLATDDDDVERSPPGAFNLAKEWGYINVTGVTGFGTIPSDPDDPTLVGRIDILENDFPYAFDINNILVQEGATENFVITRSGGGNVEHTVTYGIVVKNITNEALAPDDFQTIAGGTITWAAGDADTYNIPFTANAGDGHEAVETAYLQIDVIGNYAEEMVGDHEGQATIENTDPEPQAFYITNIYPSEAVGVAEIPVTRTGDTSQPATVIYNTQSGNADINDYTPVVNGTLVFGVGDTIKYAQVAINDDYDPGEGNHNVNVLLSGAGLTFTVPIGAIWIEDNDTASVFAAASEHVVTEGTDSQADVVLTRLSGNVPHTIWYETEDGSATYTQDYYQVSNTSFELPDGVGNFTAAIGIKDDGAHEPADGGVETANVKYTNINYQGIIQDPFGGLTVPGTTSEHAYSRIRINDNDVCTDGDVSTTYPTCPPDHTGSLTETRTCQANGQWGAPVLTGQCIPIPTCTPSSPNVSTQACPAGQEGPGGAAFQTVTTTYECVNDVEVATETISGACAPCNGYTNVDPTNYQCYGWYSEHYTGGALVTRSQSKLCDRDTYGAWVVDGSACTQCQQTTTPEDSDCTNFSGYEGYTGKATRTRTNYCPEDAPTYSTWNFSACEAPCVQQQPVITQHQCNTVTGYDGGVFELISTHSCPSDTWSNPVEYNNTFDNNCYWTGGF